MDFLEIAQNRQSCRNFDPERAVEPEKLQSVLEAGRLSPSACNSQPYRISVCTGQAARDAAKACMSMGMNKFLTQAPVLLVLSEEGYNRTAALGARVKGNDYRSIDLGILTAYLTSQAHTQGLSTCIIGWLDDEKLRGACHLDAPVRLVIALGYAAEGETLRTKKRKTMDTLVSYKE